MSSYTKEKHEYYKEGQMLTSLFELARIKSGICSENHILFGCYRMEVWNCNVAQQYPKKKKNPLFLQAFLGTNFFLNFKRGFCMETWTLMRLFFFLYNKMSIESEAQDNDFFTLLFFFPLLCETRLTKTLKNKKIKTLTNVLFQVSNG